MLKNNSWALWSWLQRLVSVQLTLFIIVAVALFFIGLMMGFLINQDNILDALNPKFWEHFKEIIGG
ncbi:DNA-directed RNA polymerase subunit beta [Staphylococcus ratti]|uniref:DNA-directed RNA polymerase subunit beta n=1 Tax=Staphylococcus ratti TaxID=2892440 RepID=A0ABY3PEH9_9STAP|nr:DNA-directed RNA polymerase subunit beta [Staphylococcus ratti]UEX90695.1 DNA-directed RNA polymerase subunit beta [Staphylococcus ratti]